MIVIKSKLHFFIFLLQKVKFQTPNCLPARSSALRVEGRRLVIGYLVSIYITFL